MWWGSCLLWDLSCLEIVLQYSLNVSAVVEVEDYVSALRKAAP